MIRLRLVVFVCLRARMPDQCRNNKFEKEKEKGLIHVSNLVLLCQSFLFLLICHLFSPQKTKETLIRVPQDVPPVAHRRARCPAVYLPHPLHHRLHPHHHPHQSPLSLDHLDLLEEWDLPDQSDLSDPWERPDLQDHPDPKDLQDPQENPLLLHPHPLRAHPSVPTLAYRPARPRAAPAESKRPRDVDSFSTSFTNYSISSLRKVLFQWIFFVVLLCTNETGSGS